MRIPVWPSVVENSSNTRLFISGRIPVDDFSFGDSHDGEMLNNTIQNRKVLLAQTSQDVLL